MKNTDDNIINLQSILTARDIYTHVELIKGYRKHLQLMDLHHKRMTRMLLDFELENRRIAWKQAEYGMPTEEYDIIVYKHNEGWQRFVTALREGNVTALKECNARVDV